jgi:hypothetical protein
MLKKTVGAAASRQLCLFKRAHVFLKKKLDKKTGTGVGHTSSYATLAAAKKKNCRAPSMPLEGAGFVFNASF